MNTELGAEAAEFGRVVRDALAAAGGDELVQRAEADPAGREQLVVPLLGELGAWDLDVRSGGDELEAAAALCRSTGYWAAPYPVAERLVGPRDLDVGGMSLVADTGPVAAIQGLGAPWAAVSLDGRRSLVTARRDVGPARKSAFVVDVELQPVDVVPAHEAALAAVLPCWTLLGMLDRAIELTCEYARERRQFGQHLAEFQGVQFQLTDAEVERAGVDALAKYALWSLQVGRDDALADALALRLAAIEAADTVFRIAHQIHGAIGFCDEAAVSWLSRYSQQLRRHPFNLAATTERFRTAIGGAGIAGIFDGVGS